MEKFRLDKGWKFFEGEIDSTARSHTECYMAAKAGGARGGGSPEIDISAFETIDLPHDFAVGHDFDEKYGPANGYKARGKGWYFRQFRLDEEDRDKELYIEFGGVATHCTVYMNGSVVYRNFSGYNSFIVNVTDMALYGDSVNMLAVEVNADVVEGWWYEGAGIYRHVDLYKSDRLHIKPRGVFVKPIKKSEDVWNAVTTSEIVNFGKEKRRFTLVSSIYDEQGIVVGKESTSASLDAGEEISIKQDVLTYSPYLWDIDCPKLYKMVTEIFEEDMPIDKAENKFGFRTIGIDKDKGFFLNGRHVPIYGTCNHQDHAGVGVAVPDAINEYRIQLLKEMGTNAYRCSHGNPSAEILDLCDEYGILVMDENRNFNSSPNGLEQVRDMVLRDRNHPSVVMYSIFNEEPLQGTPTGRKLTERIRREIEKYDDTRFITGAMDSGMMSEDGAISELDIMGFNYNTFRYDPFREKFPDVPMIGSENDSAFQTRYVYETDESKNVIDSYDSCAAPWGNTYRDGFRQIDTRKHIMGMFIWTGFDYRGEPTPFKYPSIGTQFGIMDTCGFPKDAFYLNKAFFTKEPMIHIVPSHWNFEKGKTVKLMPNTNCTEAELFINGRSFGRKNVDKYDMCEWTAEFEPGTVVMKGYIEGKEICSDEIKTAGEPHRVCIALSRAFVYGGCQDAVAVNVYVTDKNGIRNLTASNHIRFEVSGGRVLGVGNGDPNSHEPDKASERDLFNGLCQAIIEPYDDAESVIVKAYSDGLESAETALEVHRSEVNRKYIPSISERTVSKWRKTAVLSDEMPDAVKPIEDYNMNMYETVTVGTGADETFTAGEGYGLYKTETELPEDGKHTLLLREIVGDMVYIYVNGEMVLERECKDGARIELPVSGGKCSVDICIFTKQGNRAGITKPVVVLE
ncbi:MAG: beta-galactosidase GalA [Clostridia bacterium]|nr:beta-galactosidase GalA [Clostridia bacterium]